MLPDDHRAALAAAWEPARTSGVRGHVTIDELWEHTIGYCSVVCSAFSADPDEVELTLLDVGTGAGVPGVLLAYALPRCSLVALDSNEQRLDHVRRAVRALDLGNRVTVVHGRADELARDPLHRESYDVAVARLLADPSETAELLSPFVRDGGVLVVSTSEAARPRWETLPVSGLPLGPAQWRSFSQADLGAAMNSSPSSPTGSPSLDHFVLVPREGPCPEVLPRRPTARRRRPLLPEG